MLFYLWNNGDLIRVFLHFLRNSWLFNKSILKGTLESFFHLILLQENRVRKLLLLLHKHLSVSSEYYFHSRRVCKEISLSLPNINLISSSRSLSTQTNWKPCLFQFFIRKTGIMLSHLNYLVLVVLWFLPPPNHHLWGERIISYHYRYVNYFSVWNVKYYMWNTFLTSIYSRKNILLWIEIKNFQISLIF